MSTIDTQKVPVVPIIVFFAVLVGAVAGFAVSTLDSDTSQSGFQCYMTGADGECLVNIATNYPDTMTKQCVTQSTTNQSNFCVLGDNTSEHYTLYRTSYSGNISELNNLGLVSRDIKNGTGTLTVSDFFDRVDVKADKFNSTEEINNIDDYYNQIEIKVKE